MTTDYSMRCVDQPTGWQPCHLLPTGGQPCHFHMQLSSWPAARCINNSGVQAYSSVLRQHPNLPTSIWIHKKEQLLHPSCLVTQTAKPWAAVMQITYAVHATEIAKQRAAVGVRVPSCFSRVAAPSRRWTWGGPTDLVAMCHDVCSYSWG